MKYIFTPVVNQHLVIIANVCLMVFWSLTCRAENTPLIKPFSAFDPTKGIAKPWEPLTFPDIDHHTEYRLFLMEGRTVIKADSNASASGLIHNLRIDPALHPWLRWQWRIQHVLENGDVTTKQGDDCAARIYVAFVFDPKGKTWWERFRHKAASTAAGRSLPGSSLTYIWANKALPGSILSSPYTDQSKMVVVQSGNHLSKQWIDEKRNVVDDYQSAFDKTPPPIMGIAIMTDTDNTGESATAYYGDIRLEKKVLGFKF